MSTTFQLVRQEMCRRGPVELGRLVPITSLTTTTVVCSQLATGTVASGKFEGKWIVRPGAASAADRVRLCTAFTASTGTLTHAGANYSDTTATDENVEILEYEPWFYDEAINIALGKLKKRYQGMLPPRQTYKNWTDDLTWLDKPRDIRKIERVYSPQLTQNRYFQNYSTYSSSDVLTPDFWTLAGSAATMARSTTQVWKGGSSLAITRAGTDCTISQTLDHGLNDGVSGDSLRGQTAGMVARTWSAVASQVRLRITDGTDTTNSSYHTGGSGWEELTASHTVNAAAITLTFSVRVETSNTVAYVGEAAGHTGTVDDTLRRDNYRSETEWDWRADQSGSSFPVELPTAGIGSHWRISALRSYPQADWARLAAGSDESVIIDAPLVTVATGALAHLYYKLSRTPGIDTTRYEKLSIEWMLKFQKLAMDHAYGPAPNALPLKRPMAYASARP